MTLLTKNQVFWNEKKKKGKRNGNGNKNKIR